MPESGTEETRIPADDSDPIGVVLLDYAAKELRRALACLAWRGSRFHDGIHQARKSLRRCRATLALGAPELGDRASPIDRHLQRVNRSLSTLRDAHALAETLDRLVRRHRSPGTHRLLLRARRRVLLLRARIAREALHADADFARRRERLDAIAAELARLPWAGVRTDHVRHALRLSVSRASDAAARALAHSTDDDWHRWRRRVRRLSQQHRALRDSPELRHEAETDIKDLATALGEVQDYFLLKEHCGKDSPFSEFDRQALATLAARGLRRRRQHVASRPIAKELC